LGLPRLSPLPAISPSPAQLYGIEINDYASNSQYGCGAPPVAPAGLPNPAVGAWIWQSRPSKRTAEVRWSSKLRIAGCEAIAHGVVDRPKALIRKASLWRCFLAGSFHLIADNDD